jgi:hypothetical protein
MLDGFDLINGILKRFVPPHVLEKLRDRVVDTAAQAFPNWRKQIQAYRSDAAFRDSLFLVVERAVRRFALDYEDKELVDALTHDTRFWDLPSVQDALREIVTRPSSYLQPERTLLKHSFRDVLPTVEPERVERAIRFFLRCLTLEVMTLPQLAPIYQVQLQWDQVQLQLASFQQGHQMMTLQRDQNHLMSALVETVSRNPLLLASSSDRSPGMALPQVSDNLPPPPNQFFGREKELQRILDGLRSRSPLVSIEGMSGMGKTTLAIEVAYSCLAGPQALLEPPFEYVVWISAKDRPEQKHWMNEVLDTTARILGYLSIPTLPAEHIEQKKAEVTQLLHTYRTLLIIDNFETIKDAALEWWIQHVPEPSKVLITSRTGQITSRAGQLCISPIDLEGLEDPQALELIRTHAQFFGLSS